MFLKVFVSYSCVSFRKACILVSYENMESLRDHFRAGQCLRGSKARQRGIFSLTRSPLSRPPTIKDIEYVFNLGCNVLTSSLHPEIDLREVLHPG